MWIQCDNCHANITSKDQENHSKNCPPSRDVFVHPYVLDSCLYASIEIKTNEEIKGLEFHEKNNLLFLSQSLIQLCGFVIGDWCVVQSQTGAFAPSARIVWPTIEKSTCSALVTQSGEFAKHQ